MKIKEKIIRSSSYEQFKKSEPFQKRLLIVLLLALLYTLKTLIAYYTEFKLGIDSPLQVFIALINPFTVGLLLLSISLFARRSTSFVISILGINALMTLWLVSNVLYSREFSDYMSVNLILGVGDVIGGLGGSTMRVLEFKDIFYILDTLILSGLVIKYRDSFLYTKMVWKPAIAVMTLAVTLCTGNLMLAEYDRPGLLTRTFDKNYLVKYLGLVPYLALDSYTTHQTNQVRALADETGLVEIQSYLDTRTTEVNDDTFGIAEGRDIVYIHLESYQQFLIDYSLEVENEDGTVEQHEVTPFLNSLFHSEDSISFENIFHQVGGGKTSDAEMMVENSLFGTSSGSSMTLYGDKNTFYALPNILGAENYNSAVFHGNTPSFWNRTNTYKNWGYDHFYSLDHYTYEEDEIAGYGLLDEPYYEQSYEYYKNLESPRLTKFIPVTTHFPYKNTGYTDFPQATTEDETVNGYFSAANYSDNALKMFVDKLKEDGLYENTVFVLYGDHYAHSNMRNPELATLLKDKQGQPLDVENWSTYDNSALQRVPLIFHIPNADIPENVENIQTTYGGQIDILPTLLRLLGNNESYIHMGQDLLSGQSNETVVFRDGNVITPKYSLLKNRVYDTLTGNDLTDTLTLEEQRIVQTLKATGALQLQMSDKVMKEDLLRFYNTPLKTTDEQTVNYALKYKNR